MLTHNTLIPYLPPTYNHNTSFETRSLFGLTYYRLKGCGHWCSLVLGLSGLIIMKKRKEKGLSSLSPGTKEIIGDNYVVGDNTWVMAFQLLACDVWWADMQMTYFKPGWISNCCGLAYRITAIDTSFSVVTWLFKNTDTVRRDVTPYFHDQFYFNGFHAFPCVQNNLTKIFYTLKIFV